MHERNGHSNLDFIMLNIEIKNIYRNIISIDYYNGK